MTVIEQFFLEHVRHVDGSVGTEGITHNIKASLDKISVVCLIAIGVRLIEQAEPRNHVLDLRVKNSLGNGSYRSQGASHKVTIIGPYLACSVRQRLTGVV
jgi:hypothetical protein